MNAVKLVFSHIFLIKKVYCSRNRQLARDSQHFSSFYEITEQITAQNLSQDKTTFQINLKHNHENTESLKLSMSIYEYGILRCSIEEIKPAYKRFKISNFGPITIDQNNKKMPLNIKNEGNVIKISQIDTINEAKLNGLYEKIKTERHVYSIEIERNPFKLKYFIDGKLQVIVNEEQLLNYEKSRTISQQYEFKANNTLNDATKYEPNIDNLYYDLFSGKNFSIPNGPASVALDFKFINTKNLYGLPIHTTNYKLDITTNSEPYRFFHSDVYGYEVRSKMAIYGSIPYILAENEDNSWTEMIWINGADTWIDIKEDNLAHWISEAGTIEFFIFGGSNLARIVEKIHVISGKSPMPLYSALGYHQSRYTYNDERDVNDVDKNFDKRTIPYDSMWLDIEHTNGRRYFTWNRQKFPNPRTMQQNFEEKSRFMVAIIDPHIAEDKEYVVYKEGIQLSTPEKSIFVRNAQNQTFHGMCWPGSSAYMDYLNADAREFWTKHILTHTEATNNLMVWNDMNEPSVFESIEMTLPKNTL